MFLEDNKYIKNTYVRHQTSSSTESKYFVLLLLNKNKLNQCCSALYIPVDAQVDMPTAPHKVSVV